MKKYDVDVVSLFADEAMRTIALAYKDVEELEGEKVHDTVMNSDGNPAFVCETELTLICILAIEDPLRDEVPPAIAKCYSAGIDVRMVTGDNLQTAIAIAKRANILTEDLHYEGGKLKPYRAMEGATFRKMVYKTNSSGEPEFDQEAFDKIWPYLRVLARSSPDDKLTLADGLNKSVLFEDKALVQKLAREERIEIFPDRQVVAMTGDGTNDAKALKRSDVGFAIGISGTQIAKDAANIILLDDNFASIVVAAKWGRNVYDSISKFLQFQLTVNIVAVTIATLGAAFLKQSPIAAVQMLWVNLIMDALASLALATEPPEDSLLERAPVKRSDFIVSKQMWFNMLGHSIYQIIVLYVIIFYPELLPTSGMYATDIWGTEVVPRTLNPDYDVDTGGLIQGSRFKYDKVLSEEYPGHESEHYTFLFGVFIFLQLFNEFNSRKVHGEMNPFAGVLKNPYFVGIWTGTVIIQLLFVTIGGNMLKCKFGGLTAEQWGLCMAIGVVEIIVVQPVINVVRTVTSPKKVSNDPTKASPSNTSVVPEP
jgi:Ca2+ transporting ATPase